MVGIGNEHLSVLSVGFSDNIKLKTDENQRSTIKFEVNYDSVAYETAA